MLIIIYSTTVNIYSIYFFPMQAEGEKCGALPQTAVHCGTGLHCKHDAVGSKTGICVAKKARALETPVKRFAFADADPFANPDADAYADPDADPRYW
jgi:hypothetical protein